MEPAVLLPVFKIVVVGPAQSGKTALTNRFGGKYDETTSPEATIGVDFSIYRPTDASGNVYQLQVWDTAGAAKFAAVIDAYFGQANALMAVVDLHELEFCARAPLADVDAIVRARLATLHRALSRHDESRRQRPFVAVVGSKWDLVADMPAEEMIGRKMLRQHAANLSAGYWDCSARTNTNTSAPFDALTTQMIDVLQRERRVTALRTTRPLAPEWARMSWGELLTDDGPSRPGSKSCCC